MEKPKICPFCGSLDISVRQLGAFNVNYPVCNNCGITGPGHDTRSLAIKFWNTRPAPLICPDCGEMLAKIDIPYGAIIMADGKVIHGYLCGCKK